MIVFFLLIPFLFFSCTSLPTNHAQKSIQKWKNKPLSLQINPFISDGCSLFPEGNKDNKSKWLHCCILHDLAYWQGGSEQQKNIADDKLSQCVKSTNEEVISSMMKTGTGVGGSPKLNTSFRWAYGWNYTRGYLVLTKQEKAFIDQLAPKKGEDLLIYLDKKLIDPEIETLTPIYYKNQN